MHYRTRRTELRVVEPHDLDYVYGLFVDPRVAPHVRFRGATVSPDIFRSAFYDSLLLAHVAVGRTSARPLGVLLLHGANLVDGYAYLSMIAEPGVVGTGLLVEAAFAFTSHAFDTWPLRKLYIEALDNTLASYASILRRFAVEEGVLRRHAHAEGTLRDLHILALYREPFTDFCTRRRPGLVVPVEPGPA